jgi:hypothetical protein
VEANTYALLMVHTELLYLGFLFQFEDGRFEMIIIMPSNHRGLKFFHLEALAKLEVPTTDGTILDEALEALEKRRTVHELHVINMPSFKVDTNMDVQKHLRTVNQFIHPHYCLLFLTRLYAVIQMVQTKFKARLWLSRLGETPV